MIVETAENRLIFAFLASLLAHLLAAFIIVFFADLTVSSAPTIMEPQRFEIENLSPEQIQRIRQVGVRGGQGQGFSVAVAQQQQEIQAPPKSQEISSSPRQVSFGDLSPGQAAPRIRSRESTRPNTSVQTQNNNDQAGLSLRVNDQQSRLNRQQEVIQGDVLRELRSSAQAAEVLRTTGFNLQFDPPEGIEENELNTVEKIFYSFQRRTYTSYVTTFISNYHQMSFQRSRLKRILERESHDLTGRVVFNEDGDVISIRILKGSPSNDVQDLFEKTLKDLKLPNPPRDLLRSDGQFVIYYRLKIN